MSVKEWAEKVEAFLEENQELADDPTLGQSASQRLLQETLNLLTPVMLEVTRLMNLQEEAADKLRDAINDPHCGAGKVHKREKEYERLKAEQEELKHWQDKLDDFRARVHDVYMAKSDEDYKEDLEAMRAFDEDTEFLKSGKADLRPLNQARRNAGEERERKPSLWQRLFR